MASIICCTLRGFLPVAAPVLDFHPTDAPLPKGPFDALVFTSANGVAAFAGRDAGRDLPVFAVGGATAAENPGPGDVFDEIAPLRLAD